LIAVICRFEVFIDDGARWARSTIATMRSLETGFGRYPRVLRRASTKDWKSSMGFSIELGPGSDESDMMTDNPLTDALSSGPPTGDAAMRAFGANQDAPVFDNPAFTPLGKPLREARVAIVTSAALHRPDQERFTQTDTKYRAIDRADRNLIMGHWSPNFDHSGFQADINVVYPIDRLEEMVDAGEIGDVAPRHFAFAGNQPDTVSEIRLDTGPACAQAPV